jgi:acyl-homoserine-lactone acylase
MIYAQAEDDFNRVETNYINGMGRLAEAEGESKVYLDLRMKLFIDPAELKKQYAASPPWLQTLMNSFADGLNYYLAKHPDVKPRVIQRFEPWMALSFSEGSIGGDIERVNLNQLEAFYGKVPVSQTASADESRSAEPSGSNGIAIAPSNTAAHHSLLLINPHTSFFFRSELQMVSDEGLNAYGAVTWGQFFIYQGFNDRVGWMHTTSGVDAIDEYLESVIKKGDRFFYKYGSEERPMVTSEVTVPYKTDHGMAEKKFTVYRTHHGPIVREANGKWVSFRLMQENIKALEQSYSRTKARDYKSYLETMELKANSSNNTIFADADGDIAYFHGNFIPKRDTSFDWTKPVDGSNPATEWQGLLSVDETPHLLNPKSGWLYNVNNWPWSAAGASSPKKEDYPVYVENGGEYNTLIVESIVTERQHSLLCPPLSVPEIEQYFGAAQNPPEPAGFRKRNASGIERFALLPGRTASWSVSRGEQISHRRLRTAREARRVHSIVVDYLECPAGLLFLTSEIEHPMAAIHDLPTSLNQCDRGTIEIERQAILAYLRLVGSATERSQPR